METPAYEHQLDTSETAGLFTAADEYEARHLAYLTYWNERHARMAAERREKARRRQRLRG